MAGHARRMRKVERRGQRPAGNRHDIAAVGHGADGPGGGQLALIHAISGVHEAAVVFELTAPGRIHPQLLPM